MARRSSSALNDTAIQNTVEFGRLAATAAGLRDWMTQYSFPLWLEAGCHPEAGFWEALDLKGQPLRDQHSRVRVQARQLFVVALAHEAGWRTGYSQELLQSQFELLSQNCQRADGLFGTAIDLSTKALVDDSFGLYDTAFALLACASARPYAAIDAVDRCVQSVLEGLDRHAAHPDGGYFEASPAPSHRLQNPHMHLFESLLALRESGYGRDINHRIATLFRFIDQKFFDHTLGVVHEQRDGPDGVGVTFEPGHSLEWVWLLTWYGGYRRSLVNPFAAQLYSRAAATLDAQGTVCMTASLSGEGADPSARLWSQTEALKAHLCMILIGDPQQVLHYLAAADLIGQQIMSEWLEPAPTGGWHDHFDASGALLSTKMPASTGYHLFGAIRELDRALERFSAP